MPGSSALLDEGLGRDRSGVLLVLLLAGRFGVAVPNALRYLWKTLLPLNRCCGSRYLFSLAIGLISGTFPHDARCVASGGTCLRRSGVTRLRMLISHGTRPAPLPCEAVTHYFHPPCHFTCRIRTPRCSVKLFFLHRFEVHIVHICFFAGFYSEPRVFILHKYHQTPRGVDSTGNSVLTAA